jgi:hypothetical protein
LKESHSRTQRFNLYLDVKRDREKERKRRGGEGKGEERSWCTIFSFSIPMT